MKARWILIPAAALAIINAGQALSRVAPATKTSGTEVQTGQTLAPEELARKTGCLKCHSADKKIIGPPFHDIAERYKDNANARSGLIAKVKNGGKGNWTELTGDVPMPPHSARLSVADIGRVVDWVLSHKTDNDTKELVR